MLKQDQAQAQLAEYKIAEGLSRRLERVAALEEPLRAAAYLLLGADEKGIRLETWSKYCERVEKGVVHLETLNPEERNLVFRTLSPTLGEYFESVWQLLGQLPYQIGYQRCAFRASQDDACLWRSSRKQWLEVMLPITADFEQPIEWYAQWIPYLGHGVYGGYRSADDAGILFAAVLNAGGSRGEEVFEILCASAAGEHPVGAMGRHVTRALLVASRLDGWQFIEKLLLAAQRQEGLRQVILETVDEAHPQAFRRLVRLILDNDLLRFSAVVRAVDVWFAWGWEAATARLIAPKLESLLKFLEDPEVRLKAICATSEPEQLYMALWATAFEDAAEAISLATPLLDAEQVEVRFVAARLLSQIALPESAHVLLKGLDDPDLRVANQALSGLHQHRATLSAEMFEPLERLLGRVQTTVTLPALVWPWMETSLTPNQISKALLDTLGKRPPTLLIPHLTAMEPWTRREVIGLLAMQKEWTPEIRDTLFTLVADSSQWVREEAIKVLQAKQATADEARLLEGKLTRKTADLRRGVLTLLLNQEDDAALASAERLVDAGQSLQRVAGLEILRELAVAKRSPSACRSVAATYQQKRKQLSDNETKLLEEILTCETVELPSLVNGLGLFDPAELTVPKNPEVRTEALFTPASITCLTLLDQLVAQHAQVEITVETWEGKKQMLLGNVSHEFPAPGGQADLPLREVWERWWHERPSEARDQDGIELWRAYTSHRNLQYTHIVKSIVLWLVVLFPAPKAVSGLLDTLETKLANMAKDATDKQNLEDENQKHYSYYPNQAYAYWVNTLRTHRQHFPSDWQPEQHIRFWNLLTHASLQSTTIPFEELVTAYAFGGATDADVYKALIGQPEVQQEQPSYSWNNFQVLRNLSGRKPAPLSIRFPILQSFVERCRERILEIELARADLPTAATPPAQVLRFTGGMEVLLKILQALGKDNFVRGWTANNQSRVSSFSHLMRGTYPALEDTPAQFAERVASLQIPETRLLEVALYVPQWSAHVEAAVGWPLLAEAIWWIHAHTRDENWQVDNDIRETWTAQVSERTPLSSQTLLNGAVDVAWFFRVHETLGEVRWNALYEVARYAASGNGHKRAQLFADAMLGQISAPTLKERVHQKRAQDALRALGLVPLEGESALLSRYKLVQEFLRTSKQFGAQKQTSEKLAATIALENLARTAGYTDPQRLEWAMEAESVADLAVRPQVLTVDGVTFTLSIDSKGEAQLVIQRGEKVLKSVPAALKKDTQVMALQERRRELIRQKPRLRTAFETAMIRGDLFRPSELATLLTHPIAAPLLTSLIFVSQAGLGYPMLEGRVLYCHDGSYVSLEEDDSLRIAHPHDLLLSGQWHFWQQECFSKQRSQPFKQIFRELYVATEAERTGPDRSDRYAGHQVNPRQSIALLGQRSWVSDQGEGVRRTFHKEGLTAWISFEGGYFTPQEVEGLTIDAVHFTKVGEWRPLPLTEVPPRLFSEVMRDLDLVVSVAHTGGVDPEASASTIEMRSALLQESCRLLHLANVRLQGSHALIEGELSKYSVHLGSASVHRQPGGSLCIVPVHSQHRGRLFLPFADDDPRTAEVLSKVLLLARDREIQDPSILEQILSRV